MDTPKAFELLQQHQERYNALVGSFVQFHRTIKSALADHFSHLVIDVGELQKSEFTIEFMQRLYVVRFSYENRMGTMRWFVVSPDTEDLGLEFRFNINGVVGDTVFGVQGFSIVDQVGPVWTMVNFLLSQLDPAAVDENTEQ